MQEAIAVLPYGKTLGAKSSTLNLDDLEWPMGRPERLRSGTLADLDATDHLFVFPKTSTHFKWNWGTKAKISLMIVEPREIHLRHLRLLNFSGHRFHRIFTHDEKTLRRFSNARFLSPASTWVADFADLKIQKTADVSLIASNNKSLVGHRMRHDLIDMLRDAGVNIDIIGRGFKPFDQKSEGLAPYRFSVVIENVSSPSYFTEKIVDSLLCETIPIYWGAPNIGSFFDSDAMLVCETLEDFMAAIIGADQDLYEEMKPALMRAKAQAIALREYRIMAAEIIQDEA